ncbi:SubName: Full=Uncharacterized protein {ECO:0000313/EMBL:CCA68209.1} [Serendipita indica DSM 11827]|nr:SubName: Full=Uncharacterized protein {ECO:0000313/EMBL:CCA68209.1} [Serendipita indica DSM 11827]
MDTKPKDKLIVVCILHPSSVQKCHSSYGSSYDHTATDSYHQELSLRFGQGAHGDNQPSLCLPHRYALHPPSITQLASASWITYGPLKSSKYPFKLKYLHWGLIVDPAMNRFLKSQPSIEHLAFPDFAILPPDWFYFWPDFLPNARKVTAPSSLEVALAISR